MTRALLQISDPHFGTEQAPVVEALVRLHRQLKPEVVLLSGDITQRARRRQFEAARRFVERLAGSHVLAIPGNHDIPLFNLALRLFAPYANHRRAFGDELEPSLDLPGLLLLGVNTTRPWRHADGEVSREQVERVARRLRGATQAQVRVVAVHHPVAVTRESDVTNLLHGRGHALQRWAEAGCDLVVGGHIHLPYIVALHEHKASLPRRIWAVQAGTALSSRVRPDAGNSVNVLRYGEASNLRNCSVERWDYEARAERFSLAQTFHLPLDHEVPAALHAQPARKRAGA